MRIAVTGTPGCGKTTLCMLLAQAGHKVRSVQEIAAAQGAIVGHDERDDAEIIDVDSITWDGVPEDCFVDGHLSHLLPVDAIWVIRCDPDQLRVRLTARGYHAEKVQENWEAECMDLILSEAMAADVPVVQRDGSRRSPEELLSAFEESRPGQALDHDLEAVDWSDRLLQ